MPLRTVEAVRLYQRIAGQVAAAIEAGAFPPGSQLPPERISAVPVGVARMSFRDSLVPPEIAGSVECLRSRLEDHSRAPAMHCSTLDDPRAILAARDGDGSGAAKRHLARDAEAFRRRIERRVAHALSPPATAPGRDAHGAALQYAVPPSSVPTDASRSTTRGETTMRTTPNRAATLRRAVLRTMTIAVAAMLPAMLPTAVQAQNLPRPSGPITLNIVDVAGDLALTQDAFELYAKRNPNVVAKFTFTKAPAPELPGKLKAMQAAGRSDIDLVLTGVGFLGNAVEQGLLTPLLPAYAAKFPGLMNNYLPAAAKMQDLAKGQGIEVVFMPAGPLLEYNPAKVKQPPTTAQELLAWCKANPNRMIYARPANSGPGNTFIMGLPYILGDKDPKDPVNGWEKTWAYLKELNSCIEYYPTGTAATMKELGEGSRDLTVTMTGWDINPRVLGIVPKDFKVTPIKGMTWVNDAHYMVVPKGVPPERLAVLLDVMAFMLTPEAQAFTYDKGYFYPGPAVKDVPLSMAPKDSQDALKEYGRPEYDKWLAEFPHTQSLEPKAQVDAYRIWDQQIGAQKTK